MFKVGFFNRISVRHGDYWRYHAKWHTLLKKTRFKLALKTIRNASFSANQTGDYRPSLRVIVATNAQQRHVLFNALLINGLRDLFVFNIIVRASSDRREEELFCLTVKRNINLQATALER